MSKAIVDGAAAHAKLLLFVRANGQTSQRDVEQAENGDILTGDAADVTVLQLQKASDFRVAQDQARDIADRLSYAFLLNSSVQRNGERVTAEEIRTLTAELEQTLGGVYSLLSSELQLPLVTLIMQQMQQAKRLPKLPDGKVKPSIVTGLQALGRGQDRNKLRAFIDDLSVLGEEAIQRILNEHDYADRLAASHGIDTGGLLKSREQQAQEQQAQEAQMQQAQMMDMAKGAVPKVAEQAMAAMQQ
ncbi:portal protein [Nitrincola sp. A-D6]|uniref:portal protein n=1 Tax=Nitrincola sp. A-D6 TaxID=1545442 RepID=UPI0009DE17FE|nr:portal protein [Nitrincola sp. A-D6]